MRYGISGVLVILFILVLTSGCVQTPEEKNETTEIEYYNNSNSSEIQNETLIEIKNIGSAFDIFGNGEYWLKPNTSLKFYVVFKNIDEDEEEHEFIAKVYPSAVDFDVMAEYKCLHFTTCDKLLRDMNRFIIQPEIPVKINHTEFGFYIIEISIAGDGKAGIYLYNLVACQDLSFSKCTDSTTNWGPNIPLTVHILEP